MKRKVKLVKLITDDGLVEMHDDIELGKEYLVDDQTIRYETGYNFVKDKTWRRKVISVMEYEVESWFPMELLSFVKEESKDGGMGKDDGKK